jgi:hypothetical protein
MVRAAKRIVLGFKKVNSRPLPRNSIFIAYFPEPFALSGRTSKLHGLNHLA